MIHRIGLLLLCLVLLVGCGAQQPAAVPTVPTATGASEQATDDQGVGMDHGMGEMSDAPYDAQFIDSMIIHHQGAVDMARQVLAESQRPELGTLAENIITSQEAEIQQMQAWREAWFPDVPVTEGMGMHMGDMEISDDTSVPFDLRFLEAMISHHQGAIDMAQDALENTERPEIRELAQAIITAQEAEITQMRQWQEEWAGE